MQNSGYFSLPLNDDFEPIEVELESYDEKRDIDFKLIVLLFLIIMLGVLIHKQQQQIQLQSQISIHIYSIEQTSLITKQKATDSLQLLQSLRKQEKEYSLQSNKQLYSPQNLRKKTSYQQPQSQNQLSPDSLTEDQLQSEQKQPQEKLAQDNLFMDHSQNKKSKPRQKTQKVEKHKLTTKSKLLRKYIEFYLWFPFFIFALIVYSCYEKQSTQNSIFISVKTLTLQESLDQCNQCPICIADIKPTDPLAVLPCSNKHVFHRQCIKEWLVNKKTCPMCRCDVRKFRRQQR